MDERPPPEPGTRPSPIAVGSGFAILSALTFGLTAPAVERAGRDAGPLVTAALLYLGAAGSGLGLTLASRPSGHALGREHLGRLLAIAAFGAALAPTLMAWGLQRIGATTGSLLLNLEAAFTVLLARALHAEPIGRRIWVALFLMGLGGCLVAVDAGQDLGWNAWGAAAIAAATLAWALDNTLTRPLAEADPLALVVAKGALGAAATGGLALALGDRVPGAASGLALLGCGATGYGLSLWLYLHAQRRLGAARTGSIFSLAPFVGASLSWALGSRAAGGATAAAAAAFGIGVWLHVTERHAHPHVHEPIEHEHSHRHDDGHHGHVHDPPVAGSHVHRHSHDRLEHAHEHAPDLHHDHPH